MNSVSLTPMQTSNGAGGFSVQSEGYVQGLAEDDPSVRNYLRNGFLLSSETLPMWGGVAIQELLQAGQGNALGNGVGRATTNAQITGFSVFNQAHAWITTPQSQVPTGGANQTVPFYRLGSGARIPVACDPGLVSLLNGNIAQQVSWDIVAQRLQAYDASTATVSVTSVTASYAAATQLWTFVVVAAAAVVAAKAVGDVVDLSGITGTGAARLNQPQTITAFTDNQNFSFQLPDSDGSGADFTAGAQAGTIIITQGTGALNVKVLSVDVGNSKIVAYDAVNNVANWNNSGATAVILI